MRHYRSAILVWSIVLLVALAGLSVLSPTYGEICDYDQAKNKECASYSVVPFLFIKITKALDAMSPAINALATVIIAMLTWTLWKATDLTARATHSNARRQARDTRILQRAYVSVNPNGIGTNSLDQIIGYVILENGGHLPARDISWCIKITATSDRDWTCEGAGSEELEGLAVLPFGSKWTMGSRACEPKPKDDWDYVFVYGRVEYGDGFGKRRYTNFCHRYPWTRKVETFQPNPGGPGTGGQVITTISEDFARFHKNGNDAN